MSVKMLEKMGFVRPNVSYNVGEDGFCQAKCQLKCWRRWVLSGQMSVKMLEKMGFVRPNVR